MRFFGKGDEKDEAKLDPKKDAATESQRLASKAETRKVEVKKGSPLKTFVLGLLPHEKLAGVSDERFEEGLRAALPKGTKVARVLAPDAVTDTSVTTTRAPGDPGVRLYEIEGSLDVNETILSLQEKGLLEGQVDLALDRVVVLFRANGRLAALSGAAELVDRFGFKYDIHCESHEVFVQYPPSDVHKRWLADDDYRAAYQRWRTQRSEDAKSGKWHSGWPASTGDESGPPWVRLRAKDGKPDEYALEFDEKILLRFSFQGAEIKIMRFNLKILSNKLTNEFSTYRNLPLSLESIPKDVQDRLNRDPERYRALKEPGKFGQSFDLARRAYEELGGDYFQIERASTSASGPLPRMAGHATPAPAPHAPVAANVEPGHWSEQPPLSSARDYLGSDSRDDEPALSSTSADPALASRGPAPAGAGKPTNGSPANGTPVNGNAGNGSPANGGVPSPAHGGVPTPRPPQTATLRGGIRKADVGVALPLAPKPKPES